MPRRFTSGMDGSSLDALSSVTRSNPPARVISMLSVAIDAGFDTRG
jgi:hypothetical protein